MRYGGIGEVEVFKYCKSKGLRARFAPRFDSKYDLIVECMKVDVKTRCGKVPLNDNFYFNIQAEHASSDKDAVVFCYLNESTGDIKVVGALTMQDLLTRAKLKRMGEHEPNGFVYHCDTFVIFPAQLKKVEQCIGYDNSDDRLEDIKLGREKRW